MTPELAERQLILSYAVRGGPALEALLALDDALARLLRTTTEPALGQIRLQWWRDALTALDTAPPPAEPVLQGLADTVLPHGVTGTSLAGIVEAWDILIEVDTLDEDALQRFGKARGARMFAAAGAAMGAGECDPLDAAGAGWALADLARHLDRPGEADAARALAAPMLDRATHTRWSRTGRALGAMAHLARRDLALPRDAPVPVGSPARVARLAWHRLTGR